MDFVIRHNLINLCLRYVIIIFLVNRLFLEIKKKNDKMFEPRKYRKYNQQ